MELLPIFGYELCAVPPSLMDEYGCLRRGNKAILVHKLGVKHHKVWPCDGSVDVLPESLKARLALCAAPEKNPSV